MKAIFIAYDQAHHDQILEVLNSSHCRGYTSFGTVQGRGSDKGEPHLGTHAWPSLAGAMLTMVEDSRVDMVLNRLREVDLAKPRLGLRAFVWPIEASI